MPVNIVGKSRARVSKAFRTEHAVNTLEAALDAEDSRAAVEVLKAVGIYGQVEPPSGPENAELVLWSKARSLTDLELIRRGPSGNPTLDILLKEEEHAALTQRNLKEPRKSYPVT